MTEISLWQFISSRLSRSQSLMLLCVVESKGSSPGRQGFKMAVAADGMIGSIGGGVMEHKFVDMALEKLNTHNADSILRKQLHNKSAPKDQSGMICSGEQTIVIFHLTKHHLDAVNRLIESLSLNQTGSLQLSPTEFIFNNDTPAGEFYFNLKSDEEWHYREQTGYKNHLYIVGGGHCSIAFSQLMSSMDFYIHLFEERNDLNTFVTNAFANEKFIVDDYSKLSEIIPSGKNHYVVIMTFGYRTDDIALRSLINNEYKYLGVLGSKAKIFKMMKEWRNDNLPEEKLKSLYAPIGVPIHSHTPMEIAVSIAAEIVSVKNAF